MVKINSSILELLENNVNLMSEMKKYVAESLPVEEGNPFLGSLLTNSINPHCYKVRDMLINIEQETTYLYPADDIIVQIIKETTIFGEAGIM
jgi:hypothetical protein